jgi:DNA-binding CsgD family transcriptional regulator
MTSKRRASKGRLRPDSIYGALTDDDALRRLPSKIAKAVGARSAVMKFADGEGHADVFAYSYFTARQIADYETNFVSHDIWANALYASTRYQDRAVILSELVPANVFERSVFFNQFIRAHHDDTFRCLGSAMSLPLGFGMIGIHRGKLESEFQPKEQLILNEALPHLRRLFSVRSAFRLARAEELLTDSALDQLSALAFAIDRTGAVLSAHPNNAEELLRLAVGAGFQNGRLHFRNSFQAHWEHLLAKATLRNGATGGAMLLSPSIARKEPVWLEISPAPTLPPPIRAIVIIRIAASPADMTRRRLRILFGLTAAEAEVAHLASQAASPDEIAAKRSVSITTVRAQIRSIFEKLDCRSLSQLAMMVARLSR